MTVGQLVAATGISSNKLQRRLAGDDFRISELFLIATALEIDLTDLTGPYVAEVGR